MDGNHFTAYVSEVSVPYTLNLYSDLCQLYLNKTERNSLMIVTGIILTLGKVEL